MTPPHRENSHTKGSLGFRSDFAFGVRKKERFTGPIQDLSDCSTAPTFGVLQVADVHVAFVELAELAPVPVEHLGLRVPVHDEELVAAV